MCVCVCVGVANVAQTIKGNVSRKFSSLTVGPNDSRPSHTFEEPCSRSKRPSSSHSRRSHQGTFVERASYCGLEGHALLVAPRKGLGRFRPPPRLRFPVRTRHLSFETVYSRNGTSKRDQRRRGGQHSKETEYYYRSSSRTASNSPLLPCWLVVSVEWRSYRLPWKESRARTPFSRPTTIITTTSPASFSPSILPSSPPSFILQFSELGYNLRYALNHLCFSLHGASLCR